MNPPTIWLLLAGEDAPPAIAAQAGDSVIAVDGGIRHAQRLGLMPDVWLGDFDSARADLIARYAHVPRLTYPADKTQTDFELALAHINAHYPRGTLHIIGSHGNEADHSFANLWVLPQSALPCVLWQENACIISARGEAGVRFAAPIGSKISLFALTPVHHVYSHGLRWPLDNAQLTPHRALAARNEMAAPEAHIRWQQGQALLFLPRLADIKEIYQNND